MLWWTRTVTPPPPAARARQAGRAAPGRPRPAPAVGHRDLGLDVLGERLDLLDERLARVVPPAPSRRPTPNSGMSLT